MRDDLTSSPTVAVPFTSFSCGVPQSAIDYNGHMNDAAYAQVLTDANELFLDALGLSAAYRERTGCAMYTVEITIKFLHEVNATDTITAESLVAWLRSRRHDAVQTITIARANNQGAATEVAGAP